MSHKFSVITPVHLWNEERVNKFLKTIESISDQNFKDFEWIVVDDGSTEEFDWENAFNSIDQDIDVNLIRKQHEERVIAYNEGFKKATGEWFTLLDSDDEYFVDTLEEFNDAIKNHPNYSMFNFGCMFHHKDHHATKRDPFEPEKLDIGHVKFGGGNIVNGTYIWNRKVYEDLGAFPQASIENIDCTSINYGGVRNLWMGSPYDFSAAAQLEFPELQDQFLVDHVNEPQKIIKELGNPWGQDFYLFYKYTRKYHSMPIKKYIYMVNPR